MRVPVRFLALVLAMVLGFALLAVLFIAIVDPYGVSPLQLHIAGFNVAKPKRADIDRQIKPYEVWRYQPKTILLGTSRIQQGFDPSVFDGTDFAPAYNAAVPAATVGESVQFVRYYAQIDRNLRTVIFELFPYAFMPGAPRAAPLPGDEKLRVTAALWFSASALRDAIQTVIANKRGGADQAPYISSRGYWVRPSNEIRGHHLLPEAYASSVLNIHKDVKTLDVDEDAFAQLSDLQSFCDERGIRIVFVVTPSYVWDDYRLESLGFSDFIPSLYKQAAHLKEAYTFGQFNQMTTEPPSDAMRYWYDVFHFSRSFGSEMLASLAGKNSFIENSMLRLTDATVDDALAVRRAGFNKWSAAHPEFGRLFEEAKNLISEDLSATGNLSDDGNSLIVNGSEYRVVPGLGAVETYGPRDGRTVISGWLAGPKNGDPAKFLAVVQGRSVIAKWMPTTGRIDIETGRGKQFRPAGFTMALPETFDPKEGKIRVFGLTEHGEAFEASSTLPEVADSRSAVVGGVH